MQMVGSLPLSKWFWRPGPEPRYSRGDEISLSTFRPLHPGAKMGTGKIVRGTCDRLASHLEVLEKYFLSGNGKEIEVKLT